MTRSARWLPQDKPNQRSLHSTPVPRGGGVAVMLGFLVGSLPFFSAQLAMLLGLAIALSAVSFLDDWRGLSALVRVVAHMIAAAVFVRLFMMDASVPVLLLTGLCIAWMTNLYNFMDGADGLAGGMGVCGFGAYGAAAWLAGDGDLALLSSCLAASTLGFLLFNFPPARLFMGDVGSIPLGFLAAAIGSLGWHRSVWPAWFPLLVFAPFIIDASVTLARRLWRREKVWHAHHAHYYQRLVRMGWGHRKTALAEYTLMAGSAITALIALVVDAGLQILLLGGACSIYIALIVLIDRRWHNAEREMT